MHAHIHAGNMVIS